MRILPLAAAVAALLASAGPAMAGDPIMPLSAVHAGMRCTGYSVIHGTDISSFDVDVLDVADGDAVAVASRILVQVAGPAAGAAGGGAGDRAGVLGLADLLPGRGRRAPQHRRDLRVDRRVRRQDRAGDADRVDPR